MANGAQLPDALGPSPIAPAALFLMLIAWAHFFPRWRIKRKARHEDAIEGDASLNDVRRRRGRLDSK